MIIQRSQSPAHFTTGYKKQLRAQALCLYPLLSRLFCGNCFWKRPKNRSLRKKHKSASISKNWGIYKFIAMELTSILGWTATILFTICYIPQMMKTYKSQTVEGLSFLLLFVSFIANIIALVYATLIKQKPLQVKYFLGIIFLAITIGIYVKTWKRQKVQSIK